MLVVAERPYGQLRDAPVPDLRVATIQSHGLDTLAGQRAFSSMYVCYTPGITRLCRTILGETLPDAGHTAEDVVQETWLDVSRQLVEDFHPEAPVSPWLKQIARRRSIDTIRKHLVRSNLSAVDLSDPEAIEGIVANQDERVENRYSRDNGVHGVIEALDFLDRLPNANRELYSDLLVAQGLGETQEELADRYGVPIPTLKSRVQFARRAVKAFMEAAEEGIPA